MKDLDYGKGYQYAHDDADAVADMTCLPDNLRNRTYYHPTGEGVEKRIRERLEEIRRTSGAEPSNSRRARRKKTNSGSRALETPASGSRLSRNARGAPSGCSGP